MKLKPGNSSRLINQSHEYEDKACLDILQKTHYVWEKQNNKENCISKFKINYKPLILHRARSNSPQIYEQGQLHIDNLEFQKKFVEVLKKSPQMHFVLPFTSRNCNSNTKTSKTSYKSPSPNNKKIVVNFPKENVTTKAEKFLNLKIKSKENIQSQKVFAKNFPKIEEACILLKENMNNKKKINQKLLNAAEVGDINEIRNLLSLPSESRPDIDAHNFDQWTSLHYATSEGHFDIIKILLSYKCDVNCTTSSKRTPLHIACIRGYSKIVDLLLSSGCDINAQDMEGNTPTHYATQNGKIKKIKLKY